MRTFAIILLISLGPTPGNPGSRTAQAAPPASGVEAAFQQRLQEIFQAVDDDQLERVPGLLAQARRLKSDSPVPDTVQAAIHLRQLDYDAATTALQQAIRISPGYLPAWQQLLRLRLLREQTTELFNEATELAVAAGTKSSGWKQSERDDAAELLGRLAGFMTLPGSPWKDTPELATKLASMRFQLGTANWPAWERGLKQLQADHQILAGQIQQEITAIKQAAAKIATTQQSKAEAQVNEIKDEAENVRLTAAQWKSNLDRFLKQSDAELARLKRDYQLTEAAGKLNFEQRVQVEGEIGRLKTAIEFEARRSNRILRDINQQPAIGMRQQRLFELGAQSLQLEQKAADLRQQAQRVMAARQQAMLQYQQATGDLSRQDRTLARHKKFLDKTAEKANAKGEAKGQTARLTERLTQPGSYFLFDFEQERQRILTPPAVP